MNQFVPNAPCGVESRQEKVFPLSPALVPNAPCGVESSSLERSLEKAEMFLMHRVELKEQPFKITH